MSIQQASNVELDLTLENVYIAGKPPPSRWDICCRNGVIASLEEHRPSENGPGFGTRFLSPSLCHPHIHLDKCFLLGHPKYADLEIENGDFAEAMKLTSEAKSRFEHDDLMERGRALIEESINFGVTHMRAFVEVDLGVKFKCLEAGLALKEEFRDRCYVQICVFAQDPIFSYADKGKEMTRLLENAVTRSGVEAFGTTPYVEKDSDYEKQMMNIEFAVKTAKRFKLHLDFHIDYNLDSAKKSMVVEALKLLHSSDWPSDSHDWEYRTVIFGHCTRLTKFDKSEWLDLCQKIQGLPVSFVGLPTSDLFMMGRPHEEDGGGHRVRGTLQVLQMIKQYGLNATLGINNVGNAFTPQGSCDPLNLASLGVGVYQAGTKADAELLLQCVSKRAKMAMGMNHLQLGVGQPADFVVFGNNSTEGAGSFRSRKTVQELIYDPSPVQDRTTIFNGRVVSG